MTCPDIVPLVFGTWEHVSHKKLPPELKSTGSPPGLVCDYRLLDPDRASSRTQVRLMETRQGDQVVELMGKDGTRWGGGNGWWGGENVNLARPAPRGMTADDAVLAFGFHLKKIKVEAFEPRVPHAIVGVHFTANVVLRSGDFILFLQQRLADGGNEPHPPWLYRPRPNGGRFTTLHPQINEWPNDRAVDVTIDIEHGLDEARAHLPTPLAPIPADRWKVRRAYLGIETSASASAQFLTYSGLEEDWEPHVIYGSAVARARVSRLVLGSTTSPLTEGSSQ